MAKIDIKEASKRLKVINPKLRIVKYEGWTSLSTVTDGSIEYKARIETLWSNNKPWLYHPVKSKTSKFTTGISKEEALKRLQVKLPSVKIKNYKTWTKTCDFYCTETKLKWQNRPHIAAQSINCGRPETEIIDKAFKYHKELKNKFGSQYKLKIFKSYQSIMVCKDHGEYIKAPWACLNQKYGGCTKCRIEQQQKLKELSLQEQRKFQYPNGVKFLDKTRFGRLYNCPIHGNFYSTDNKVLKGCGCLRCIADKLVEIKSDLSIPKGFTRLSNKQHLNKLRKHYTWLKIDLPNSKKQTLNCFCTICRTKWKTNIHNLRSSAVGCPTCGNKYRDLKMANEPKIPVTTNNSRKGLQWILFLENTFNIQLQGAHHIKEYQIKLPNNKIAYVDGYNSSTKEVYEFLGDYWHGNPLTKYKNKDKYADTMRRLQFISSLGYIVHYVWESDYDKGIAFSGTLYPTKV